MKPVVRVAFATVALTVLLCPSPVSSGTQGTAPVRLEYDYLSAASYEGDLEAACDAWGIDFHQGTPNKLSIRFDEAELVLRKTWENGTILLDRYFVPDERYMDETVHEMEAGSVSVSWPRTGRATAYDYEYDSGNPFHIEFNASHVDVGSIQQSVAGPAVFYLRAPDGYPAPGRGDFPGWSRTVDADQSFTAFGDLSLRITESVIQHENGSVVRMEPEREVQRDRSVPGVEQRRTILNDAFLHVRNARFEADATTSTIVCASAQIVGRGDAVVSAATGTANATEETFSFENKVLSYSGEFTVVDEVGRSRDGAPGHVKATSEGDMAVVGVDFQTVVLAEDTAPVAEALTLIALLALVAAALAKYGSSLVGAFYARFSPQGCLKLEIRQRLRKTIQESPGLTVTELARRVKRPRSSIRHHLGVMASCNLIRIDRESRFVVAWPANGSNPDVDRLRRDFWMRRPKYAFLTDYISNGPTPLKNVTEALSNRFLISDRAARHIVQRASKLGLVSRRRRSGRGQPVVVHCVA